MDIDPKRVKEIFLAAAELTGQTAQSAYLKQACGEDSGLRERVEALLRSHDPASSFLGTPAAAALIDSEVVEQTIDSAGPDSKSHPRKQDEDEALGFLAPSTRPDSLGRIGHYEALQVLGKGGFGIVLRAFDDILQRVVAIKVMAPQLAATSPARKRFLREARSSAQVRHENVVQVYEVVEQPLPYLVMEFIPGETLQQRLDRTGPLEIQETLRIGRQIAEGLAAAHATDLIHRDIKPGNVLLEGGNHKVKITDFGLARAADDASMTQSGMIAGTPLYMAPEQALGQPLDQRADLFSLGSVLYQMVSGRAPFRANTTIAVLKRVAEDTPRNIREIIPETPKWLCDIIAKLHAKNPDERFQSAREVADVLADCEAQLKSQSTLKDYSLIPRGVSNRSERKWISVVAALLLLPLVALAVTELAGVTHLFQAQKPVTANNSHDSPTNDSKATSAPSLVVSNIGVPPKPIRLSGASIIPRCYSPDGKWLVAKSSRGGHSTEVTVWEVATGRLKETYHCEQETDQRPAFSPDGRLFAVTEVDAGQQFVTLVETGTFRTLKRFPIARQDVVHFAFSRTGNLLGTGHAGSIKLFDTKTGVLVEQIPDVGSPFALAFSPTADQLAYEDGLLSSDRGGRWGLDSRIVLIDLDPKSPTYKKRLQTWDAPDNGSAHEIKFTPDGGRLVFCRSDGTQMHLAVVDVKTGQVVHEPKANNGFEHLLLSSILPDGKTLVTVQGVGFYKVYIWNLETGKQIRSFKIPPLGGFAHLATDPTGETLCAGGENTEELQFYSLGIGGNHTQAIAPFTDADVRRIAVLTATEQVEEFRRALKARNPAFDGTMTPTLEGDAVVGLSFSTEQVKDLSPVRALTQLTRLEATGLEDSRGLLTDLSVLNGLPLSELVVSHNNISDLSPLKGMSIQALVLDGNPIKDLSPLQNLPLRKLLINKVPVDTLKPLEGLKLEHLDCIGLPITDLSALRQMPLKVLMLYRTSVSDLTPLSGMKIEYLNLQATKMADLSPLKDTPLMDLHIGETQVTDLSPLKDLPLKKLFGDFAKNRDYPLLRQIKTLEIINDQPAAEYLKDVTVAPFTDADVRRIAALPANEQVEEVRKELKKRNPDFDGTLSPTIENDVVTGLEFFASHVSDISPVRGLPRLTKLNCRGNGPGGMISDLKPLQGMQLEILTLSVNPVSDLSPLKGMPLTELHIDNSHVDDLTPLTGMPLKVLNCSYTKAANLAPLKESPLLILWCNNTEIADLSPLKEKPLEWITIQGTRVADISALKGMPLTQIYLDYVPARDRDILRSLPNLQKVNDLPLAEFWQKFSAKPNE